MGNKTLITQFYTSFKNQDAAGMIACYHDEIEFHDQAFGQLKGERAKGMWRMLCQNAKDLKVEVSEITADEKTGKAHWEAFYTFSQTGKKVHNIIDAKFEFKDGKIIRHYDDFNLKKWATQAMGWKGWLLGNTDFFKKKLQTQTNRMLDKFMG